MGMCCRTGKSSHCQGLWSIQKIKKERINTSKNVGNLLFVFLVQTSTQRSFLWGPKQDVQKQFYTKNDPLILFGSANSSKPWQGTATSQELLLAPLHPSACLAWVWTRAGPMILLRSGFLYHWPGHWPALLLYYNPLLVSATQSGSSAGLKTPQAAGPPPLVLLHSAKATPESQRSLNVGL